MRKEGIQTRKRKPKQNSGNSSLGSLGSVLGPGVNGGLAGSNGMHHDGMSLNHHQHPATSLHNSLMNNHSNQLAGHNSMAPSKHHGFHNHHHNSQQAAAAAAAAAAAVAAAVADSAVKLQCT